MTIMEDICLVLYAWKVGLKKWVGGHVEKQPVPSSMRHKEGLAMATTVVHELFKAPWLFYVHLH